MNHSRPTIRDLLARDTHVLHTKWRFNIRKRIVELDGQKYVLYRFRWKRTMERFEATVRRLALAGITVQAICARTSTVGEYLRYGYWIALSYLPGQPLLPRNANRIGLASLARAMARLNSLEGPPRRALFERRHLELPHAAYLAREPQLSDAQRQWIRESLTRLSRIPATQLVHGDLFSHNIIQDDDHKVGLIDYELFGHDVAGIELAATLLRPFCRLPNRRATLLRVYLRTCSPPLRQTWTDHGRDLVFAAAARLALGRQDRLRHVARRERLLGLGRLVPHRPAQEAIARRLRADVGVVRAAQRNEAYYGHVARTMIELCLADPQADPLALLQQCDARFRKQNRAPAQESGVADRPSGR